MIKKVTKRIPDLRFSEFDGAWKLNRLKEISSISSGVTPLRSNKVYFQNADIPWVKTLDLNNSEITTTEECISEIALKETSARKNPIGSILIAMYGGFNQIGRTGLLTLEATTNQAISVVVPEEYINSHFLLHFLNHNVGKWRRYAASSRKDPNITSRDVGDFLVLFPPKGEQEKLASFLEAIATHLTQLRRKHELLQTYKRGVMQKIFSQRIRFKQDDGSDFPDWEKKKLKNIFDFHRGGSLSKSDLVTQGRNLCIHYGQLFTLYKEVIHSIQSRTNIDNGFTSNVGDILMPTSDVTPIGLATASTLLQKGVVLGGDMNILRPTRNISSVFFSYLLNFEKKKIIRLVSGTTVRHIYSKDLKSLQLWFPIATEEQDKIANFLTSLDHKAIAVERQIKGVEKFKQCLLQKMFV